MSAPSTTPAPAAKKVDEKKDEKTPAAPEVCGQTIEVKAASSVVAPSFFSLSLAFLLFSFLLLLLSLLVFFPFLFFLLSFLILSFYFIFPPCTPVNGTSMPIAFLLTLSVSFS